MLSGAPRRGSSGLLCATAWGGGQTRVASPFVVRADFCGLKKVYNVICAMQRSWFLVSRFFISSSTSFLFSSWHSRDILEPLIKLVLKDLVLPAPLILGLNKLVLSGPPFVKKWGSHIDQ